mmetsp:Transcript_53020/g.102370  ORF Transcript_53020/g.102370 Transcript_53020/m.102370 type:complete len:202 (+) Transcript_53020:417-1022(+)
MKSLARTCLSRPARSFQHLKGPSPTCSILRERSYCMTSRPSRALPLVGRWTTTTNSNSLRTVSCKALSPRIVAINSSELPRLPFTSTIRSPCCTQQSGWLVFQDKSGPSLMRLMSKVSLSSCRTSRPSSSPSLSTLTSKSRVRLRPVGTTPIALLEEVVEVYSSAFQGFVPPRRALRRGRAARMCDRMPTVLRLKPLARPP